MKIDGSHTSDFTVKNKPQSVSLENQIRKLEEQKRKIEQDLAKKSTNPDPIARIGDNNANSAVNRKILEKIEAQLKALESRNTSNSSQKTRSENNETIKANTSQYSSEHIDIYG